MPRSPRRKTPAVVRRCIKAGAPADVCLRTFAPVRDLGAITPGVCERKTIRFLRKRDGKEVTFSARVGDCPPTPRQAKARASFANLSKAAAKRCKGKPDVAACLRAALKKYQPPPAMPAPCEKGEAEDCTPSPAELATRRECEIVTPAGREPARYALLSASRELVTSHNPRDFSPDPRYPPYAQERVYHRDQNEQSKVILGSQRLIPSIMLANGPTAVDGPPIVAGDGLVLGGNGRSMMLRRAYAEGLAESYRAALLNWCELFGFTRAEVEALQDPVLVRVVPKLNAASPAQELAQASSRYNQGLTNAMDEIAQGVSAARRLSPATIDRLAAMLLEDVTLRDVLRDHGRDLARMFEADGVFTPQDRARMRSADGGLTEAAKTFVESAFVGLVLGTSERIGQTPPALRGKVERLVAPLVRVAGRRNGHDLIPEVQAAVDLVNRAKLAGMSPDEFQRQGSMFGPKGGEASSPRVLRLANLLTSRGPKQIAGDFARWARAADTDPTQGGMFGTKPATPEAAFELLFEGGAAGSTAASREQEKLARLKQGLFGLDGLDGLNAAQSDALRRIRDAKGKADADDFNASTLRALVNRGLVQVEGYRVSVTADGLEQATPADWTRSTVPPHDPERDHALGFSEFAARWIAAETNSPGNWGNRVSVRLLDGAWAIFDQATRATIAAGLSAEALVQRYEITGSGLERSARGAWEWADARADAEAPLAVGTRVRFAGGGGRQWLLQTYDAAGERNRVTGSAWVPLPDEAVGVIVERREGTTTPYEVEVTNWVGAREDQRMRVGLRREEVTPLGALAGYGRPSRPFDLAGLAAPSCSGGCAGCTMGLSGLDGAEQMQLFGEKRPAAAVVQVGNEPDLRSYDYILVNTSAGKDSQVMMEVVVDAAKRAGVADRLVAVHCDLGEMEWDGTRALAEQQSRLYGLRFEVVAHERSLLEQVVLKHGAALQRHEAAKVVLEGLKRSDLATPAEIEEAEKAVAHEWHPPWPGYGPRWCTSEHKTAQVVKLETRLIEEARRRGVVGRKIRFLNCLGLRAAESSMRAACSRCKRKQPAMRGCPLCGGTGDRVPFEFSHANKTTRHTDEWLPILALSTREVWDRMKRSRVPHHRAYDLGMKRLSCVLCIYPGELSLALAAHYNPDLLKRYIEVERRVGWLFRENFSLQKVADLVARTTPEELRKVIPDSDGLGF